MTVELAGLYRYIGGAAGCGKTWMARERVRSSPYTVRMTASTGIAAINLGQSEFTCTTINSLLWFYDTRSLEDAWTTGKLDVALRRLHDQGIEEIIIDEISMMSGRQVDLICKGLDYLNEQKNYQNPIGLTLIGDFCQLPPVAEKEEGFAFEARFWDRFEADTTILTEIKRQADPAFVEALRRVRRGEGGEAVGFFKPRMEKYIDVEFEGTTIMAKNLEVDRFNEQRLERLDTPWVRFPSHRFGDQLKEWEKIPQVLDVKIDALVMVLVNKSFEGVLEYVNGDLGYVRDYAKDFCTVELIRTGQTVTVEYTLKENKIRKKGGGEEVLGTCEHMPLRVAYATTCHKSQGLTLDRVQINLNNRFFTYGGMAYVGLSRARTAEGLRVVVGNDNTFVSRCKTNPRVIRWL